MSEPIHIISLGAGVQSSTMALMAAAGEITPMPNCAIFADTQAEPKSVYTWLDWLEKQLPFPVHRVTKGSLAESALRVRISKGGNSYTNSNVPDFLKTQGVEREGVQKRQCTKDFKIDVILQKARGLAKKEISDWRKLYPEPLKLWRSRKSSAEPPCHSCTDQCSHCARWTSHNDYATKPTSNTPICSATNAKECAEYEEQAQSAQAGGAAMSVRVSFNRLNMAVEQRLRVALRRKKNHREREGRVDELIWVLRLLRDPKHNPRIP